MISILFSKELEHVYARGTFLDHFKNVWKFFVASLAFYQILQQITHPQDIRLRAKPRPLISKMNKEISMIISAYLLPRAYHCFTQDVRNVSQVFVRFLFFCSLLKNKARLIW